MTHSNTQYDVDRSGRFPVLTRVNGHAPTRSAQALQAKLDVPEKEMGIVNEVYSPLSQQTYTPTIGEQGIWSQAIQAALSGGPGAIPAAGMIVGYGLAVAAGIGAVASLGGVVLDATTSGTTPHGAAWIQFAKNAGIVSGISLAVGAVSQGIHKVTQRLSGPGSPR